MSRIAVFGGSGYLASLIKNSNNKKTNTYTFFSRRKNDRNYINFLSFKKNLNTFKNFDIIIHLIGPNQNLLKKDKKLIKQKNQITSNICDLCLANNIKLIYLSSMQIYKDYGVDNILINSKLNLKSPYSKSHNDSEKIILKKFKNSKKNFIILRMGNVFGFNKIKNIRDIQSNLIHNLCFDALKKKNILINNGYIQRTIIPSQIFLLTISSIINRNLFNNSIENVFYKNLSLKEIAYLIKKRLNLLFKFDTTVIIKKFNNKKKFKIYSKKYLNFKLSNKKIYVEIDQVLKTIKKFT